MDIDLETLAEWDVDDLDQSSFDDIGFKEQDTIKSNHHGNDHRHSHQHQETDDLYKYPPEQLNRQQQHYQNTNSSSSSAAEEYKVRYNVLRQMYEQRLRSLVTQMHTVYADTTRDAAVQVLGNSGVTMPFQDMRRQEVVQEAIESDAENSYRKVAHSLAKTESKLHKANKKISELKRQIRHMHETDSNVTRTSIRSLKMQKGNDSMLNATEIEGHHKVGDEDENEDNDGEEGKEEDDSPLIQRLNRMEHLLERVASSEEKTSQRKRGSTGGGGGGTVTSDDSEDERESKSRRNIESHPSYVALVNKMKQVQRLLSQSERERLELRQKYIAIGQNVEQLIRTDSIATSEEITRLRSRCKKYKSQISTLTKKAKIVVKGCNEKIEFINVKLKESMEREQELKNNMMAMDSEAVQQRIDAGTAKTLQEELDRARDRISTLESTLEEQSRNEISNIDSARIEAREEQAARLTDAEVRCAKLEGEIIRVRSEQDERIRNALNSVKMETQKKYEALVEKKLNDLKEAHEKTLSSHEHAKMTEDKLREQVGIRLKKIAEDHITIEQHDEILRTKLESMSQNHELEMDRMTTELENDCQTRLEEQHYQLRAEFSVKEAELKRTIVERETEVREAQDARDNSIEDASEERRVMLSMKEQLLEETSKTETLQSHLKEAGMNLTRLKKIVTNEREKRTSIEEKYKILQDRRIDEEKTMKRELKVREEKHTSDVQLLESAKTQLLRAENRINVLEETIEMKTRDIDLSKTRTNELEESIVELQKKLRSINGLKDDVDVLLVRKEKELIELRKQLEICAQSKNESNTKLTDLIEKNNLNLNNEINKSNQELLKLQKMYRECNMNLIKKTDEVEALNDRMNSAKLLSKEREAALVQQLQTYRQTSKDTTTSAEHAYHLQIEHMENQLKEANKYSETIKEENDTLSSKLRSEKSNVKQIIADKELLESRLDSVNQINTETVAALTIAKKESIESKEEIDRLTIKMTTIEKKLNDTYVTVEEEKKKIVALNIQVNECNANLKKATEENVVLKQKVVELETEIENDGKKEMIVAFH
jgi:hypothetical protein